MKLAKQNFGIALAFVCWLPSLPSHADPTDANIIIERDVKSNYAFNNNLPLRGKVSSQVNASPSRKVTDNTSSIDDLALSQIGTQSTGNSQSGASIQNNFSSIGSGPLAQPGGISHATTGATSSINNTIQQSLGVINHLPATP